MDHDEETVVLFELHLSDDSPAEEEGGYLWKDILREGTFAMTPTAKGAVKKPFSVVAEGDSSADKNIISMSDIEHSFDAKAFEHVTIPLSHKDSVLENTGYVKKLRRIARDIKGKTVQVLQGGMKFTEPDVEGRVKRGSIPNCSSGIFLGFTRKSDGERFPAALKHTALTPTPWITDLRPFNAIAAADDEIEDAEHLEFASFTFAEGENEGGSEEDDKSGDIIWMETDSIDWRRRQIQNKLNPPRNEAEIMTNASRTYYYVEDMSDKAALVQEETSNESNRFVIPYTVEDGEVKLAPATRWVEAKEVMIAASDDDKSEDTTVLMSDVLEKLHASMKAQAGDRTAGFKLSDVTTDGRVKIVSKLSGAEWLAQFSVDGEDVHLAPLLHWQQTKEGKVVELADKPAKAKPSAPVNTVDGRLEEARQNRRRLLAKA